MPQSVSDIALSLRHGIHTLVRRTGLGLLWIVRAGKRLLWTAGVCVVIALIFMGALNYVFRTPQDFGFRILDPAEEVCKAPAGGWDVLAKNGNDERLAIDRVPEGNRDDAIKRASCAIQTHRVERWKVGAEGGPDVKLTPTSYDLAFVEFKENGDPYMLCSSKQFDDGQCDGTSHHSSSGNVQLEALRERLGKNGRKNFVVVFVHGWRHNAQIGDGNVADLRTYTAHAARFVADRCDAGDLRYCGMVVTGVFVGWRGARTDEIAIDRFIARLGKALCGDSPCFLKGTSGYIGNFAASLTLFDRKPVSEAIAPNVFAALQSIEDKIGVQEALRDSDLAQCEHEALAANANGGKSKVDRCFASTAMGAAGQGRMLVFGHSLGGNLLITALHDRLVKRAVRHNAGVRAPNESGYRYHDRTGDFVPPALGNLTVLINPAAEAGKWLDIQRAVLSRMYLSFPDKGRSKDYSDSHLFFHPMQPPTIISVTSARDWPPGGLRPSDCAALERALDDIRKANDSGVKNRHAEALAAALGEEVRRRDREIDYDWATYDLFPTFRMDFRPLANSLDRYARRNARADGLCLDGQPSGIVGHLAAATASILRLAPFMNTDAEQTRTIGHFDPPRPPQGITVRNFFSGRPLGTTHEVEGWGVDRAMARRNTRSMESVGQVEASLDYDQIGGPKGQCPPARNWLTRAIAAQKAADPDGHGTFWDAAELPEGERPSLRFVHGFRLAGLSAITRPTDPFWNVRALDNALAEHDGYLLTSFICAMSQLVLDDPTEVWQPPPNP